MHRPYFVAYLLTVAAIAAACSSQVTSTPVEPDAGIDATSPPPDANVVDASEDAQPPPIDAPVGPTFFECAADAGAPTPATECTEIAPGSFGDCTTPVGIVYSNGECLPTDGCTAPFPPGTFMSMSDCQLACSAAGKCNTNKLFKFDLNQPLEGQFCDDVEVVGSFLASAPPAELCAIAPHLRCESVSDGTMRCRIQTHYLSAEEALEVCALSLSTDVEMLRCWVYL